MTVLLKDSSTMAAHSNQVVFVVWRNSVGFIGHFNNLIKIRQKIHVGLVS